MSIHYDARNRRWRYQFDRILGGRRRRFSKLLPAAWDRARAAKWAEAQDARLYALASGVEPADAPLIADAIRVWLDHRKDTLKNGAKAAQDLAQLVPYLEGRPLPELPEAARAYCADHAHLAPATLKNRLAYLKAAVRYAFRRHGIGDRDYTARMEMPAVRNTRQTYLRIDGLERLLAHIPSPDGRAMWRIAWYTGLRWISEIHPRQPDDVIRTRAGWWLLVPDSKTGTPHMVPVHPAIRADLGALPFPRKANSYYREFVAARAAEGLPGVVPHDLRHSLASALISSGATLAEVAQALNHKSIQSTRRYAHLYPERTREIIGRLPHVKNPPTPAARRSRKKAA